MKVNAAHPHHAAHHTTPAELTKAFVKSAYSSDVGFDAVDSLPKATHASLPKGSDVAEAIKVFGKWADGAEVHTTTALGQKLFVVSWQADETGGVELFNAQGKRLASDGWGEEGPTGKLDVSAKSRWYDEAKSDLEQ